MSELKVEVVSLDAVNPHPNADRLELAQVKGWNVVIGRGRFKAGDLVVYFPVDSILPEQLENQLFPPDSKIKLNKHRIRTIKIRGAISQGMVVPCEELGIVAPSAGDDLTEKLGVTKFEPPDPEYHIPSIGGKAKKASTSQINTNFSKYTDIQNIKNHPSVFKDGEPVYISEKMHGTSARYGWVPRCYADNVLGKIKRGIDSILIRLKLKTEQEFVYGSRNVQLQTGSKKSWYSTDVYTKILNQESLREILKPGECIYGEIVGDRIQKNYNYGCGPDEHRFFAYDVMKDGRWLNYEEFAKFCDDRKITRVPELYVGPYSNETALAHRDGDSTVGGQKIREGVVIKPTIEAVDACGRKVLKSVSDAYYLEDNTDFH